MRHVLCFKYTPDTDSTWMGGYGPETHTIHKIQATKYGYYVTNFDHHISSNEAFHASGARVFLYQVKMRIWVGWSAGVG